MKQSQAENPDDVPDDQDQNSSTNINNRLKKKQEPKGAVYINDLRCKGCSFCVAFCPKNVLTMGNEINEKGYILPLISNPENCNGCNNCGLFCPDFAIFGIRSSRKRKNGPNANSSPKSSGNNGVQK